MKIVGVPGGEIKVNLKSVQINVRFQSGDHMHMLIYLNGEQGV